MIFSCLGRTVVQRCSLCFVAAVTVVANVGSDTVFAVQVFCYVLGRKWCKSDFSLNKEKDFERKDAEGDGNSFKHSITKINGIVGKEKKLGGYILHEVERLFVMGPLPVEAAI